MADVADIRLLAVDGVPEIRVMAPKPGEVYVLTFPGRLSADRTEFIVQSWFGAWGGKEKAPRCLILSDGAKIELMKSEEVAA